MRFIRNERFDRLNCRSFSLACKFPGDKPKDRRLPSAQWDMGIKFLYFKDKEEGGDEKKEEVKNWFFCEICGWLQNAVLGGGTGNLLEHARKHANPAYTFSKDELSEVFATVAKYAKDSGKGISANDFNRILPEPDEWYVLYRLKIRNLPLLS